MIKINCLKKKSGNLKQKKVETYSNGSIKKFSIFLIQHHNLTLQKISFKEGNSYLANKSFEHCLFSI